MRGHREDTNKAVRFSLQTNVCWRPPALIFLTESDGQLLPVLALPHGSVESDFAPLQLQRTSLRTLLLLSVMRKRILVPRRVEAHQRYMVGSSSRVFPGLC